MQVFANNVTVFVNQLASSVATEITLDSTASLPVITGDQFFTLTFFKSIAGIESDWEIVKVTAINGNKITCVRGFDGTTQREWLPGSIGQMRVSRAGLADLVTKADGAVQAAALAAPGGAGLVGYNATSTVAEQLDILYYGVASVRDKKYSGGAKGDGSDDSDAIQATYADAAGKFVYWPDGDYKVSMPINVQSGTRTHASGGATVVGSGTHDIFHLNYPSAGTTFDGLSIDGNKLSGTADVVVLIYAPGSFSTPNIKSRDLSVSNCQLKNASAAIGFENALYCDVHDNRIEGMYRHTAGAYAGVYGYGVVFNGCKYSSIHDNFIGSVNSPIERHGIYMPVFRDQDVAPTVLHFTSDVTIKNNHVFVRYDPANEPFSSCIESWNYFDITIIGNKLFGGVRGINTSPEYTNGTRVTILGNTIKDSTICVRNGPASFGPAPASYYFEKYTMIGNTFVPRTDVLHQCVRIEAVKQVVFSDNDCVGVASNTAAFLYVGANNVMADVIESSGNTISGFLQGFYLRDVVRFDDESTFKDVGVPYTRLANITRSSMRPKTTPPSSLYVNSGVDWDGVEYFELAIGKRIRFDGNAWVDADGTRVRGTAAQRPTNVSGSAPAATDFLTFGYGFKYFDTDVGAVIYWNGCNWFTSQQPAPPQSGTTTDLNAFKTSYPNALHYGANSFNTTTLKPVFYDALNNVWKYADGTSM